jgi:hypothetical protein
MPLIPGEIEVGNSNPACGLVITMTFSKHASEKIKIQPKSQECKLVFIRSVLCCLVYTQRIASCILIRLIALHVIVLTVMVLFPFV